MDKDPSQIREEIEATRARMGATVDALEYQADVPARMKDRVAGAAADAKDRVTGAAAGAAESARRKIDALAPQGNALGLVFGAFAAGALLGFMLPHTDLEDERIGDAADRAKEQMRSQGRVLAERGKEAAQAAAQSAAQTMTAGGA